MDVYICKMDLKPFERQNVLSMSFLWWVYSIPQLEPSHTLSAVVWVKLWWCDFAHTVPESEDSRGLWGLGPTARPKKSTSGCKTEGEGGVKAGWEESKTGQSQGTHDIFFISLISPSGAAFPGAPRYPHFCPLEAQLCHYSTKKITGCGFQSSCWALYILKVK